MELQDAADLFHLAENHQPAGNRSVAGCNRPSRETFGMRGSHLVLRMWETNIEGGCPREYEVLGLLGRQAGGGGRVPVRTALDPCVLDSGSQTCVHGDRA